MTRMQLSYSQYATSLWHAAISRFSCVIWATMEGDVSRKSESVVNVLCQFEQWELSKSSLKVKNKYCLCFSFWSIAYYNFRYFYFNIIEDIWKDLNISAKNTTFLFPLFLHLAILRSSFIFKIKLINIKIVYFAVQRLQDIGYFHTTNTHKLYKTVAYSRYIVELTLDVRVTYKDILRLSRVDFQNWICIWHIVSARSESRRR